jgi:integrase
MVRFEPFIRSIRSDGYAQVYIRINHKSKTDYIKTNFVTERKFVKNGKVADQSTQIECAIIIKGYIDKLNGVNTDNWTAKEVKDFLLMDSSAISFTDFANEFINDMIREGRDGSAENYRTSLNSLKRHFGKDDIRFNELTSKEIVKWIKGMKDTKRAKNMYPKAIKTIFEAGLEEYNDYDNEVVLIKNRPFRKNMIPRIDVSESRSIDSKTLKKILTTEISGTLAHFGRDVAAVSFCLAGINAVDLYALTKSNIKDGKLCYNRKKTKDSREDKAYIEIQIPAMIRPLFEKYKGDGDALFDFSHRYISSKIFNRAVNDGLKQISAQLGIENTTTYTFRHSWATIAQNHCGASTELVGFCLNHTSAHKITEKYIKKDFSRIDVLNEKVINYVFAKK